MYYKNVHSLPPHHNLIMLLHYLGKSKIQIC